VWKYPARTAEMAHGRAGAHGETTVPPAVQGQDFCPATTPAHAASTSSASAGAGRIPQTV